jgi:hypothetical protein
MHNIDRFAALFQGRLDAYGTEDGGCDRAINGSEAQYLDRIEDHLYSNLPMGVYPMVPAGEGEFAVGWGCVDFDEGDEASWVYALNLQAVLEALGVTAWIERSRSKGYHVWVFLTEDVSATSMRRALLGATQIAQAPTKEINPKAETLKEGKIGNYVRLPYLNGHLNRRVMVDPQSTNPIEFNSFVEQAWELRATPEDIEKLVPLWAAPPKPKRATPLPSSSDKPAIQRLGGLAYTILQGGPLDGSDRSGTLWKLANLMYVDGLTWDEAQELLYDADVRWGKYHDRDATDRLDKMLDDIWGN